MRLRQHRMERGMANTEKDRAAAEVVERHVDFELALSNKRKYPLGEFKAFLQAARRYIETIAHDPLIHKDIVQAVHGLREFLEIERKRVPEGVLVEAERLECQLFAGYDPHFEGDEPPGL